jgi:GNAT superfamily N-acetyltransferase
MATCSNSAVLMRKATVQDIPRLLEMGMRFHQNSPYKDHLAANPEQMGKIASQIASSGGLLVSENQGRIVGMFGFVTFPHFLSGELIAAEVFWWVEPEHRGTGKKLLYEAENMAREAGAKKMQMIAPDARVGRLYEHMKYKFVESAYQKSL